MTQWLLTGCATQARQGRPGTDSEFAHVGGRGRRGRCQSRHELRARHGRSLLGRRHGHVCGAVRARQPASSCFGASSVQREKAQLFHFPDGWDGKDSARCLRASRQATPVALRLPAEREEVLRRRWAGPSCGHSAVWRASVPLVAGAMEPNFRSRYLMKVGITQRTGTLGGRTPTEGSQTDADTGAIDMDGEEDTEVTVSVNMHQQPRQRATDDFRLAYIQKLSASRATIPHLSRPKAAQTVTIFDWDDTLMATTHIELVMQHFGGIPASTKEQLKALEKVSCALLELACKNGKVVIITNATEGWVQHSSSLCMPAVRELLNTHPIEVISARGTYEQAFPGDCHAWKVHAFLQVQRTLNFEAVTNLISIGDSVIEMDAVHVIGRCVPGAAAAAAARARRGGACGRTGHAPLLRTSHVPVIPRVLARARARARVRACTPPARTRCAVVLLTHSSRQ